MSEQSRPQFAARQFRRVRRWSKHTPNGEIILSMFMIAALLLVAAALIVLIAP